MVFESVVAEVLNRFLGAYVNNLDRSQLKLDIWSGKVALQKLNLKENAFDGMNLPIKIVSGSLSKLVMHIPWSNLYNAPVVVNVEGLSVLAVPNLNVKYNQKAEEAIRIEAKRKLIESYENSQKVTEKASEDDSKEDSFVEKLSAQIIKNVQITIANIHIRYEDDLTNPRSPLALGITLHSVLVKSTDSQWNEKISDENQRKVFKVVSLDSLAIYFNTSTEMYSEVDRSQHGDLFSSTIVRPSLPSPAGYSYLFGPIQLQSRLCIDPKPELEEFVSPKIWFSVEMQCVQLALSRRQYHSLTELLCSIQRMSTASRYRKYRPQSSLSNNPKLCWQFAYRVILNEVVRRRRRNWSWVHMNAYIEMGRRYHQAYRIKLTSKSIGADIQARISDCEYKLDLVNLMAIRRRVEAEVGSRLQQKSEGRSGGGGWFRGWFGGSSPASDDAQSQATGLTNRLRTALTAEERHKLYAAIDYNGESSSSEFPAHYESVHTVFCLNSLVLLLQDDSHTGEAPRQILCARLNGFSARVNQRPASNGVCLLLDIVELRVDGVAELGVREPPALVSTQAVGNEKLLSLVFETNPLSEGGDGSEECPCDSRLRVRGRPLKIVYHSATVQSVSAVLQPPQHVQLAQLQDAAVSRFQELRHASALRLQSAIETRHRLDVMIDLMAPLLIIPRQGAARDCPLLALRLGQLLVASRPYAAADTVSVAALFRSGSSPEQIYESLAEKVYDRFKVELSDIEVAVAGSAEASSVSDMVVADWRNMRLVEPISLSLQVGRCVIFDDPRLPLVQLQMHIPLLELCFSDQRLSDLAVIASSLSPQSSSPAHLVVSRGGEPPPLLDIARPSDVHDFPSGQSKLAPSEQLVQLQASFRLDRFSVRLFSNNACQPCVNSNSVSFTQLASFSIVDSFFSLKQCVGSMEANGSVDRVFLESPQFETEEDGEKRPVMLLSCGNQSCPVLSLRFSSSSPISSGRALDLYNARQNLKLSIGDIDVHIHQESVCSLISVLNTLGRQLSAASGGDRKVDGCSSGETDVAAAAPSVRVGSVSRLEVSCTCLQLRLSTAGQHVMQARVQAIAATCLQAEGCRHLQLEVGAASVLDLLLRPARPVLLTAAGQDLLAAQMWLYDRCQATEPAADVKVHMKVGGVKLVFLQRFLSDLAAFGSPFAAQQRMLAAASQQAAGAARHAVQAVYQRALRLQLHVVVRAPLFVVPQMSDSHLVLLADLGNLCISNTINTDNNDVFDDIMLCLDDVKLSTAVVDLNVLSCQRSLAIETERVLLAPVSFSLSLRRCLTAERSTDAPELEVGAHIQRFSVTLDSDTYQQLLSTAAGNLAERPLLEADAPVLDTGEGSSASAGEAIAAEVRAVTPAEEPAVRAGGAWLRFSLDWCLVGVELRRRGQEGRTGGSLGQLSVLGLKVQGQCSRVGQVECTVTLDDCVLEDSRPDVDTKFRRLMHKMVDAGHDEVNTARYDVDASSLFRVYICQSSTAERTLDIRINRISLILYLPYFLMVADFFTYDDSVSGSSRAPSDSKRAVSTSRGLAADSVCKSPSGAASAVCTRVKLTVQRPDFALVESIDVLNPRAVVFHAEIELSAVLGDAASTLLSANLTSIRLFTCQYSPAVRASTTAEIVSAFDVKVEGERSRALGTRLAVSASPLSLHMNAAAISLLSSLSASLAATSATCEAAEPPTLSDCSDVWRCWPVEASSLWYMVCEVGEEAGEHFTGRPAIVSSARQQLEVCLESVNVTVEQSLGSRHIPLVLLESSLSARLTDWSSALSANVSFTVEMNYYNSCLSVWEPIIDRVEQLHTDNFSLIPLKFVVDVRSQRDRGEESESPSSLLPSPSESSTISAESEDASLPRQSASVVVRVYAENTVQLTVSRTFLHTLVSLQSSMAEAVAPLKASPAGARSFHAQLVVRNCLADLLIVQPNSTYTCGERAVDEIMINPDGQAELLAPCWSAQACAPLSFGFVAVQVPSLHWHVEVPLTRAEPRYYRVPAAGEGGEPWGLVCDVTADSDCRTLTVRSIVEVENQLEVGVQVYYRVGDGCLQCDGVVEPGQCISLSLAAVYTAGGELFFSPADHAVSTRPYVWRSLLSDSLHHCRLECPRKGEPGASNHSFGLLCDGQALPILFEGSHLRTYVSRCVRIYLRPVVVLHNLLPYTVECRCGKVVQLPPGEQCHLSGFGVENRPQLRVEDSLGSVWETELDSLTELSEVLVPVSLQCGERRLHVGLHARVVSGTVHASLYAPYWMINSTGAELSYVRPGSGADCRLTHPAEHAAPLIFSHGANLLSAKRKISVCVANSAPSARFSLDTAGDSGLVTCTASDGHTLALSVNIALSSSGLTRHVVFSPCFVVVNKAGFAVQLSEVSGGAEQWLTLAAGDCRPWWPSQRRPTCVCRVAGTEERSPQFAVATPGRCLMQLNNCYGGIEVEVQASGEATVIVLHQFSEAAAAVRIVNWLSFPVHCSQVGAVAGEPVCAVPSQHCCLFAWRRPADDRRLVWSCSSVRDRVIRLEEEKPIESAGLDGVIFYCVSFIDGQQRTVLFTDDCSTVLRAQNPVELERIETEVQLDIDHIGISLVNNVTRCDILYISIIGSGVVWEAQRAKGKRFRALEAPISAVIEEGYNSFCKQTKAGEVGVDVYERTLANGLHVNFAKLLMLSPHRRHLRRTYRSGLWLRFAMSQHQRRVHLMLNRLQVDNQLEDCVFPVVLAAVQPSSSVTGDSVGRQFVEAALIETLSQHSSVCQFKYAHVLVQEFHIRLEIGLLAKLAEFFDQEETTASVMQHSVEVRRDLEAASESLAERVAITSGHTDRHFFDDLHFSPLKVHLSFSMAREVSPESGGAAARLATGFVHLLLQSVGVTATDMDDVIFRLAYFERLHEFMSFGELVSQMQSHYISQALRQIYVLLLGLDVIGNPFGLVLGFGDGVSDLFYEPVQGAIQGPGEFVEGLALGVRSLLSHAVGGTAGAVSRITGTLGKGVAALSLDDDFRRNRQQQLSRQPAGLASGLAYSGRSLVMGVYDGITGVIRKPLEGAQRDGTVGFLKGFGVGAAGLFARPASGAIDFASGSLNAVRRSFDRDETGRLRPPRHFFADGVLRPYERHQAEGAKIFKQLGKGRYVSTDQYLAHCVCSHERREVLIVTDHRLLLARLQSVINSWQLEWTCLLHQLDGPVSLNTKGLQLPLPPSSSNVFSNLFNRNVVFKQINIQSTVAAQFILNKIDEAVDQLEV